MGEGPVVLANDLEVDDQAWTVVLAVAQKIKNALGHRCAPHQSSTGLAAKVNPGRRAARRQRVRSPAPPCDGDTASDLAVSLKRCLGLEREIPLRTPGKSEQASSVSTFGGPTRPKKPAPPLL